MPAPPGATSGGSAARGSFALSALLSVALIVTLVVINLLVLGANNPNRKLGQHFYLALGDSVSFGFQPNLDFRDGFVDDVFADTRPAGVTDVTNFACAGETTVSMLGGGCPGRGILHDKYAGSQLDAAITFLHQHAGRVSPVTLEMGANDVLPFFDSITCSAQAGGDAALAQMDTNLTTTIFPRLVAALTSPEGHRAGDLHLLNYYNPFAQQCPTSVNFIHRLNDHLAADAAQFKIPVIDVYSAFGGDADMAAHVCAQRGGWTWVCDPLHPDIHPTTQGYSVIAAAVEAALGYPGTNPPSRMPSVAPGGTAPRPVNTPTVERRLERPPLG